MKKSISNVFGSFVFCMGIGTDQITPKVQSITFFKQTPFYSIKNGNERFIKPKMYNVKPQPFSVQINKKK